MISFNRSARASGARSGWVSWAVSAVVAVLCAGHAMAQQQVIDMAPGKRQSASTVQGALSMAPAQTLAIRNMPVDDTVTPMVNLTLRKADNVNGDTQFVVVNDTGHHPLPPDTGARFVGTVDGDPDSTAFVSIAADGQIRAIVHKGGETMVNEYSPGTQNTVSAKLSRTLETNLAMSTRQFTCGVEPSKTHLQVLQQSSSKVQPTAASIVGKLREAATTSYRADVIIDTDYEFFLKFGSTTAAAAYVTDLMTYVSQRYQSEIATRLNIKRVLIRNTASDPWTRTGTETMLYELQNYWNSDTSNPYRAESRHHVHLLSGKSAGGGIAYLNSLNSRDVAYGVSADITGGFNPQNPQFLWDTIVVAHELGHAFGSSHTHDYDNPYVRPSPDPGGGAIDCCYSSDSTSQCGITLRGANMRGNLPGLSSISGGTTGQRNGTIMSYCHQVSGGLSNIAWSLGTSQPYGVNAIRVPLAMKQQAQAYLPVDTPQQYTLTVSVSGSGTVTSSPTGIQCGSDCTEPYDQNTVVTLVAAPASGFVFSGWGGACSGTGSCSVTMSAAQSVLASFMTAPKQALTITKTGAGNGTISSSNGLVCSAGSSSCLELVTAGTILTVSATADSNSIFGGWSSSVCSGTGACVFNIKNDTTVTAIFNSRTGANTCVARPFVAYEERVLAAYIAYYGRPADTGGLAYWAGRLSQEGGNLSAIINAFGNSPEFTRRFGGLSNRELVRTLYQQLYGRDPDPAGWTFYVNLLDTGRSTLAVIAINVLDGTSGNDLLVVENRKKVARHFVTSMEAKGSSAPTLGDSQLASLISGVTADSTATSACQSLTGLIGSTVR